MTADQGHAAELRGAIGPYRIAECLGQGGMGDTFRVVDDEQRTFALKVLRETTAAGLQRFRSEIAALSALSHPHISKIIDHGTTVDGRPYYVSELCVGGDAERSILFVPRIDEIDAGQTKINEVERDVVRLGRQIASALDHAHRAGIIHRDVKPSNILLRADGSFVLADFGVAKDASSEERRTESDAFLGTIEFMAPEQIERAKDVDGRADLFGLAATAIRLLIGRAPRRRELVRRDREIDPPIAAVLADAGVSPGLIAVLMRAVDEDPTRRYATAGGFAEDLAAVERGSPPIARRAKRHWSARLRPRLLLLGLGVVVAGPFLLHRIFATTRTLLRTTHDKRLWKNSFVGPSPISPKKSDEETSEV